MNTPRLSHILLSFAAALALLWALVEGLSLYHGKQASQSEAVATQHVQEANSHVQAAESLPDHSSALADAQANSDRAWAEVRRLRKIVDAKPSGVPDQTVPATSGGEPASSLCAEQLAADRELIEAQDKQIQALKLALSDEQKRSAEFRAAFESERKARQAQEAATEAWKKAVTENRWKGRIEGFAAGAALGYLGGRR